MLINPYRFKSVKPPFTEWVVDSSVIAGLVNKSGATQPCAFYLGGELYMIVGWWGSGLSGYKWNGSTWVSDTSIVGGISATSYASLAHINYEGTDILALGRSSTQLLFYEWNGSSWVSTSYDTGFPSVGGYSAPSLFLSEAGVMVSLVGETSSFVSADWNVSTWATALEWRSGLSTADDYFHPCVFYLRGILRTLIPNYDTVYGYYWNGSTWVAESLLLTGLTITGRRFGTYFLIGDQEYYVTGTSSGGYVGYRAI